MLKKVFRYVGIALALLFMLWLSAQSMTLPEQDVGQLDVQALLATPTPLPVVKIRIEKSPDINELPLRDNMNLYQYDDPDSVVHMYLTVRRGNKADNTDHSWQEVNDFTKFFFIDMQHVEVGRAEAILQVGDEKGPVVGELGYGATLPNAVVQVRGNTASRVAQKSYKIELFDMAGEWRDQSTIALNKHIDDYIRARNKLCFDLMIGMPGMVTLRTQFVHLFVKDETTDPPADTFVDYGLFTQIEQPNQRFLRNHLLDPDAQFYKTYMFEFERYPEKLRLADDPLYDEAEFSTIMEIKSNRDHSKLIQMLEDVNNWAIPIEQTFDKYFDAENYFYWMAYNILIGNIDTGSQNFYLYSPQNGQKWYFIPWDYDGALFRLEREYYGNSPYLYYERGIATYWPTVLHKRVLMQEKYRAMLDDAVHELMKTLTPERISAMLAEYKKVTDQFVFVYPDVLHMRVTSPDYEKQFEIIPQEIQVNYQLYLESLEAPMPFYLGEARVIGDSLRFNWEDAYDFDARDITYVFTLARDWTFEEVISEQRLTNLIETKVDIPGVGQYFWKVVAYNENGKMMLPFDYYRDAEGDRHDGMKSFYLIPDGKVLNRATALQ